LVSSPGGFRKAGAFLERIARKARQLLDFFAPRADGCARIIEESPMRPMKIALRCS